MIDPNAFGPPGRPARFVAPPGGEINKTEKIPTIAGLIFRHQGIFNRRRARMDGLHVGSILGK